MQGEWTMKKCKAISFSFDDGIQQDKRLITILDRYGLKASFKINSGLFDRHTSHEAMLFGIKTKFFKNLACCAASRN